MISDTSQFTTMIATHDLRNRSVQNHDSSIIMVSDTGQFRTTIATHDLRYWSVQNHDSNT